MILPSTQERRTNRLILLALWLVFYCSFTLFTPPLLDDADSVHAEVAREMLLRHDFVTLYANGIRYLEKAPLFYWAMAACMRVFGVTAAASRLPLAFSVLALALLLESFARRAFASSRAGLYAGLIALSSFGIFIFSRINIPDVLVCMLLCISLYAFYLTESPGVPARSLCYLFAIAIALNLLTKGLIAIVFPFAIVTLYLFITRGLRGALHRLAQLRPVASFIICLIIAAPWHILAALANPGHGHPGNLSHASGHWQVPPPTDGNVHGWAWFYFLNEQLFRYLNLRVPHDYDTAPLWLFLGLIFVWLMPWSAFLPSAVARAFPLHRASFRARLRTHTLSPEGRTTLFLILWAAIPLAFFTFSTRQEYYVLPSLPPMILLIAAFLAEPKLGAPHLASEIWEDTPPASLVVAAADAYLRDHLDQAIAKYQRLNTSGERLSISSDAARELLPGYSTPTERTANTFTLSPASSRLAEAIWRRALETGPSKTQYIVEFLTGSPGSGKTSSFIGVNLVSHLAIVREGMMDDFTMSAANIQQAIDSGFVPTLQLVYVSDPRVTLRRAVSRSMEYGRVVSIAHMSSLYVEIPKTVARLKDHFQDNLGLQVYSNSIDGRIPVRTTLEEALRTTGAYTTSTAREAMLNELEALRNDGRVSAAVYSGFLGARPSPDATAGSRALRTASRAGLDRPHRKDQSRREGPGTVAAAVSIPTFFLLILGTLLGLTALYFFLTIHPPAPGTDLATLLQQNPADYALSFGHFLDLTTRALGLFPLCLILTFITLTGGPLAHFLLRRRNHPHAATLTLAAFTFLFLFAAHRALVIFAPTLSSKQLADAIAPQLHPQDLIAIHGEYEAASTLGFYLRRNDLHIVEGRSSNLWYGSFFPDAPRIFNSREEIARMWLGPQRIFLWQDPSDHDRPPLQLPGPIYVIANSGGKQILSNQPSR